jgi:hypothetical protein
MIKFVRNLCSVFFKGNDGTNSPASRASVSMAVSPITLGEPGYETVAARKSQQKAKKMTIQRILSRL